ncbi:hypothetical protein [Mycobacteroides abscessus]|nr:hypothetical protein [Mycobacteroides abscessus]
MTFAKRTAPGGAVTRMEGFRYSFRAVRLFADYLSGLAAPPTTMAELVDDHIDGFRDHRRATTTSAHREVSELKVVLRNSNELTAMMVAKVCQITLRKSNASKKASYSRDEFTQIARVARSDLRAAATRIRKNRELLRQYRAGKMAGRDRRLELLEFVEEHTDVPRYTRPAHKGTYAPKTWVRDSGFGSVAEVVGWLHLTCTELAAAAILMGIMTGQNRSVILNLTTAHHRTDGHVDGRKSIAILDTYKPRRGARAYMNLALAEIPDWITLPSTSSSPTARDELHTPFGLYALLLDLTSHSRQITDTDRLLVGYHANGTTRGIRALASNEPFRMWSARHKIQPDASAANARGYLSVTLDLIRLTYVSLHQKPVAHTETTLVKDYLSRDRGNLGQYRQVVAAALAEEVDKARSRSVMETLSRDEIAQSDACALAAKHGIEPTVVKRMLAGELDTVMNSCIDNDNSPFGAPGQPCRASFMKCLECPCARALPHHLPVQALVFERLQARKADMTPLAWAQRFARAHTQLADLLSRHDAAAVAQARADATPQQHAMVDRFINREMDIR